MGAAPLIEKYISIRGALLRKRHDNKTITLNTMELRVLDQIQLAICQDVKYLHLIRQSLRMFFSHFTTNDQHLSDMDVIATELCSNAIIHGKSDLNKIIIDACHDDRKIHFTVTDFGKGFNRESVSFLPPERTAFDGDEGHMRFGGMGLPLVESLAENCVYDTISPQGTKVSIMKRID